MLLIQDGPCLPGHPPVEEEGPGHVGPDQRDDVAPNLAAGRTGDDSPAQPAADGLGELLLPGIRQQGVSGRGRSRDVAAPPVAVREAQGVERRVCTILIPVPDRATRPGATALASAQVSECARMKPCPRAGCGKSARPVR